MAKNKVTRNNISVHYPKDSDMPERWHDQADRLGMSVSNLVANVLDTVIAEIENTLKADIGNIGRIVEAAGEEDGDDVGSGEGDPEGAGGEAAQAGTAPEAQAEGQGEAGQEGGGEPEPVSTSKRKRRK